MRYLQTVWASLAACSLILLPYLASGQQDHQPQWQGGSPPASFLQSRPPVDSSQKPAPNLGQSPSVDHRQLPPAGAEQAVQQEIQPSAPPGSQDTEELTAQKEIPPAWPPTTPPTVSLAGYLGANTRDFYRERLCMHAMTIKAVEVTSVDPGSPAERAGLRAAKAMTGREVITATVAGLLVLSPAAPLAAHVLRAAGGVDHGDLILAVGGKRVTTRNEFERALSGFGPQTVVYLTVRRGDTISQVPVRLEQGPTPDLSASLQQTRLQ